MKFQFQYLNHVHFDILKEYPTVPFTKKLFMFVINVGNCE